MCGHGGAPWALRGQGRGGAWAAAMAACAAVYLLLGLGLSALYEVAALLVNGYGLLLLALLLGQGLVALPLVVWRTAPPRTLLRAQMARKGGGGSSSGAERAYSTDEAPLACHAFGSHH